MFEDGVRSSYGYRGPGTVQELEKGDFRSVWHAVSLSQDPRREQPFEDILQKKRPRILFAF